MKDRDGDEWVRSPLPKDGLARSSDPEEENEGASIASAVASLWKLRTKMRESGDAGGREGCGTCNYRDEDCEMTKEQMSGLQPGNIVRGKSSGDAYVVTANYGDHVTAVRTVDLTNPGEWDLISGCGDFVEHPASKPRHA